MENDILFYKKKNDNICTKIVPENGNNVWHPINKQKGSWVPIHPNPTPDPEEDNSKKKKSFQFT